MGWYRLGGLGAPEALARPLRDPPDVDIVLLLFRPGDTLSETERARGGEGGRGGGGERGPFVIHRISVSFGSCFAMLVDRSGEGRGLCDPTSALP